MPGVSPCRKRTGIALQLLASLALLACGRESPPTPSPRPPLSFTGSVKVGGFCCLLSNPKIAVDADRVFVAWTQAIRYTTFIPLRRSSDAGRSFPDELAFADATSGDRETMRLAVDANGALDLVWEDSRNGSCDPFCRGYQLFATRSVDGGATFAANRPIAASPVANGEQTSPVQAVAADGDVFVAWQEQGGSGVEVRVARSLDAGVSYQPAVRVDPSAAAPDQRFPSLALPPDGRVYVAWLDGRSGRPEVYLAHSVDRGVRFGSAGPLHPSAPEVTDRAGLQLAVTGTGRLVAVWTERRAGRWRLQGVVSLDGGQSFTTPRALDAAPQGDQTFPVLAVYGADEVYVAWQDSRSGAERLRIARSTDGADTFEASLLVDDPGAAEGNQQQPDVVVDAHGSVLAVWLDFSKSDSGVYLARSGR
jgi:hypothetical protein